MKNAMNLRFAGKSAVLAVLLAIAAFAVPGARAQTGGQRTFSSSNEALDTIIRTAREGNASELLAILGPGVEDAFSSGDPVADKTGRERFLAEYDLHHSFSGDASRQLTLNIGKDSRPFPIPLVRSGDKWYWDGAAGKQEIVDRRIGSNELATIEVCKGLLDAQHNYAAIGHDNQPAGIYAQQLVSDPGKQNGLYWPANERMLELTSPARALLAQAAAEGYGSDPRGAPYRGYRYRILKAQGANVKGGARSYIIGGFMTYGFALVAYPAGYRSSGVMTFMTSQSGRIYQKDLGEKTAEIVGQMTEYNPDSTWKLVK